MLIVQPYKMEFSHWDHGVFFSLFKKKYFKFFWQSYPLHLYD